MGITRNIVPRQDSDGKLGDTNKKWLEVHCDTLYADTIDGLETIPIGTVFTYAGTTTSASPSGYLFCDGSGPYLVSNYPNLYAKIGIRYGGTAGVSFYVPDYRGIFQRGYDNGRGLDPNAATRLDPVSGLGIGGDGTTGDDIGTYQSYGVESHEHLYTRPLSVADTDRGSLSSLYSIDGNESLNTGSAGGDETRPVNMYVNYIIKY